MKLLNLELMLRNVSMQKVIQFDDIIIWIIKYNYKTTAEYGPPFNNNKLYSKWKYDTTWALNIF